MLNKSAPDTHSTTPRADACLAQIWGQIIDALPESEITKLQDFLQTNPSHKEIANYLKNIPGFKEFAAQATANAKVS